MARDLGNPVNVSQAQRRADRRQRDIDTALRAMMENRQTRLWLFDLLEFCNIYRSSFATSGLVMAQAEGQRNVGLRILADIMRVSPAQYVLMLTENKETDDDGTDGKPGRAGSERLGSDSLAEPEPDPLADPGTVG